MCCNGLFSNNNGCSWILILIILILACGGNNNGCGCNESRNSDCCC